MGYLIDTSQTLSYEESKILFDYIKRHGIIQFLHLYKKFKDSEWEDIYWGDEIELHLLNLDHEQKKVRLQLNNEYMFNNLSSNLFELQPEYGAWMLETVPIQPYKFNGDPTAILENLYSRRKTINSLCQKGDILFQGAVFPLMKVGDFCIPKQRESVREVSQIPEEDKDSSHASNVLRHKRPYNLLNPHPRYSTLCENLKQRRGDNLCIKIPIYKDENTSFEITKEEPFPGSIHMDDMIFGTGNTSVQFTFGTKNMDDARYLTDQMSVFSSVMLPLSAASAIFKGKLADVDVRWDVLGQSVDCRTREERDPSSSQYVPKTRWSTVSRYISSRPQCKEEYNDVYFPIDKKMMALAEEQAQELGIEVDEKMIKHLGFLFAQDPLIIYTDRIYVDDTKNNNHFENIQSTNWNNVRFKPPPSFNSEIGWRVELRTVECQLTADENVAFGMLAYFFAQMVMKREYNFYIPISKVDENIKRGQKRDALLKEKFWFRKNVEKDSADEWAEFTLDEILHGKSGSFVGLFNLIYEFCKEEYGVDLQAEWAQKKLDSNTKINVLTENMKYFEILSKRAKGEVPTIASWIRSFVLKHPKYNKDSIITPEIGYDLVVSMTAISDNLKTYSDFM